MKLAGAYINDDTYERLVALATANNRTLAGQCRHLFDKALKEAESQIAIEAIKAGLVQKIDSETKIPIWVKP